MGSAVSCGKCSVATSSSVINLSDALILRMVEGIEMPKTNQIETTAEDSDWIEKIKCIDDAHSIAYGLTVKEIDALMQRLERRIREGTLPNYCPADVVKGCYRFNKNCTLQCAREVDEFINCLDAKRLQKLHTIMEEAKRKKEQAEKEARTKKLKSR